jgi:hypothetical protein
MLTLSFWPQEEGARIELVHVNVPEADFAGVSHGWAITTGIRGELFAQRRSSITLPVRWRARSPLIWCILILISGVNNDEQAMASVFLFTLAGLCRIGGRWLVW